MKITTYEQWNAIDWDNLTEKIEVYGLSVEICGTRKIMARDGSKVVSRDKSLVFAYDQSTVEAHGQSTVRVCDKSTVEAYDQSTVRAFDQSTVEAYDQSTVEAYGQSTVEAYGQSTIEAHEQSTVEAFGQSTIEAHEQSTVESFGQSTVEAYGQSTVTAHEQSKVTAHDQSKVTAFGQSTVTAFDQSTVFAFNQSTVFAFDKSAVFARGFSFVRVCSDVAKVTCESQFATVKVQRFIVGDETLIGYKKLCGSDAIATLQFDKGTVFQSERGSKCRAEKCDNVIDIETLDGEKLTSGTSRNDTCVYEVGKPYIPSGYEESLKECAKGVHFFLTREEAENYE